MFSPVPQPSTKRHLQSHNRNASSSSSGWTDDPGRSDDPSPAHGETAAMTAMFWFLSLLSHVLVPALRCDTDLYWSLLISTDLYWSLLISRCWSCFQCWFSTGWEATHDTCGSWMVQTNNRCEWMSRKVRSDRVICLSYSDRFETGSVHITRDSMTKTTVFGRIWMMAYACGRCFASALPCRTCRFCISATPVSYIVI